MISAIFVKPGIEALPFLPGQEGLFGFEKMSQSAVHLFYRQVRGDFSGSLDVISYLRRSVFQVKILLILILLLS